MLTKFALSLNQLASDVKKVVTSLFLQIEEESIFEASLCPRRSSGRSSSRKFLFPTHLSDAKIYESILEAQIPEKHPSSSLNLTTAVPIKSGDNTEMTFGRVNESSQRQIEMSHNTASFKRYDDSSYEMLTQQFARISPQASQLFMEKVSPVRVLNYWKKIYKETRQKSSTQFYLNLDIVMPFPVKSEKPSVEFRYNKRTKTYDAVRLGLKRRYSDISLPESAASSESDVRDSEQLILKKPKLENSLQRERRQPLNFHSRRKLTRKMEHLKAKINL